MPTLGEASRLLRISRHTLDKWIKRLAITPTRHPFDYRHFTITDADLQRIAEARAQLPQLPGAIISIASKPAFDRRQSGEKRYRDTSPARSGDVLPLPDGMMGKQETAIRHGIPPTTLLRWCREGLVETDGESYGGARGQFAVKHPVTRRGLAQLYALAHQRPDFTPCSECPHDAPDATPEAAR